MMTKFFKILLFNNRLKTMMVQWYTIQICTHPQPHFTSPHRHNRAREISNHRHHSRTHIAMKKRTKYLHIKISWKFEIQRKTQTPTFKRKIKIKISKRTGTVRYASWQYNGATRTRHSSDAYSLANRLERGRERDWGYMLVADTSIRWYR